jgi:tetratricopeptide (TPR) repeat protein
MIKEEITKKYFRTLNWLNQIFNPPPSLDELINSFKENEALFLKQKEVFERDLLEKLSSNSRQITDALNEKNIVGVVQPTLNAEIFVIELLKKYEAKSIYIRANRNLKDTEQLALIIIKELGHQAEGELFDQLKKITEETPLLIGIDGVEHVAHKDLKQLIENSSNSKFLFISKKSEYFKNSPVNAVVELGQLLPQDLAEMSLNLVNLREELIVTSADRQEIAALIEVADNSAPLVYMALNGAKLRNNLPLKKHVQNINASPDLFGAKAIYWKFHQLPLKVQSLCLKLMILPESGFCISDVISVGKDLFVNENETITSFQYLTHYFNINTYQSVLDSNDEVSLKIYYLPTYLREFLNRNYKKELEPTSSFIIQASHNLLHRLENGYLWNERTIWITQLEQSYACINWLIQFNQYNKHKYFFFYIQSVLIQHGLWRFCQDLLVPLCKQAINKSETNEDRGYWYCLLGMLYKEFARYEEATKNYEQGLQNFHKALKFYDPNSQRKKYKFVYENIGEVLQELGNITNNILLYKDAIKSYYRALGDDKGGPETLGIKWYLAQVHFKVGLTEKPLEHLGKSIYFYNQILFYLRTQPGDHRVKLVLTEIDRLNTHLSIIVEKAKGNDKKTLQDLQKQVSESLAMFQASSSFSDSALNLL